MSDYARMTKRQLIERLEELDGQLGASQGVRGGGGSKTPGQLTDDEPYKILTEEVLKESEEKYRAIFEKIGDGYWETDLAGRLTFINDAMCRIAEATRDELLSGVNFSNYADPETAKRIYKIFEEVYLTGKSSEVADYEVTRRNGSIGVFQFNVSLIRDDTGQPVGFRGITRDVTERRAMESALRESEASHRNVLTLTPDAISIVRREDARYLQVNDAFCWQTGYTADEIIGRTSADLNLYVDPADRRRLFSILEQEGRVDGIEIQYRAKGGTILDDLLSARRIQFRGEDCFLIVATVITSLKEAQESLRQSEERYRTILESIKEGYFEVDLAGNYTFVNDSLCDSFGYKQSEIIGTGNRKHTNPETAKRAFSIFNKVYLTGKPAKIKDYEVINKDGGVGIREMHVSLMRDSNGNPVGFRGLSRDVTERVRAERALKESEERYRTLFEKTPSPIMITDPKGRFIDWNKAALEFLECTREKLSEKNIHDFLPPEARKDEADKEKYYWKRDSTVEAEYLVQGRLKILELSMTPASLNGKDVVFGVGKDITERRQTEEKLAYMATHDHLTGLPNRTLFSDRLEIELEKSRRNDKMLAVILFDLDRFKEVNDTLGHGIGDLLLKELGYRLKGCLRKSDTVARMGGDEFFILLCDIKSEKDADIIADKVLETIRMPFVLDSNEIHVTASLGVAFYPKDGDDVETLIQKADIAMYEAKGSGRDHYGHYLPLMENVKQ